MAGQAGISLARPSTRPGHWGLLAPYNIVLDQVQPSVLDLLKAMKLDQYFTVAKDEQSTLGSLHPVPTL